MPSCFVLKCKNNNKWPKRNINFHAIPKRLQSEWLHAIGRDPFTFVIQQRVCSEHFHEEDYEKSGALRRLKPTVVPSRNLPTESHQYVQEQNTSTFTSKVLDETLEETLPSTLPLLDIENEVFPNAEAVRQYIDSLPDEREMVSVDDVEMARDKSPQNSNSSLIMLPQTSDSEISNCSIDEIIKQRVSESKKRKRTESVSEQSDSSSGEKCKQVSPAKSSATLSTKVRMVKAFHSYSRGTDANPDYYMQKMNHHQKATKLYEEKYLNTIKTSSRCKIQIKHLKLVINKLEQERLLSENALSTLVQTIEGVPSAMMQWMATNRNTSQYPQELKCFAMTLQFYNAKAVQFVRKTFSLSLPGQSTLRAWFSKADCTPGFSKPAFTQLNKIAEEYVNKNKKPLLLALTLAEMSLKKDLIPDRNTCKVWGYVDFGADIPYSNNQEVASEALVLMVVGVNLNFETPVGYFFVNQLTGQEKANVVKEALHYLSSPHYKIISLTCDGPHINLKMMTELGCNVGDPENFEFHFLHPVTVHKIYVLFDLYHMLNLMRINWTVTGIYVDPNGEEINWKYVEKLHELLENEEFLLENQLHGRHMEWKQLMTKVNLAAQTLSAGVADALDFLCNTLKLEEFKGADATIKFIRTVDKLFYLLNSRHPYGKDKKTPLKVENEHEWKTFLENSVQYLLHLENSSGELLRTTVTKKVPFLGFAISCLSLLQIYAQEVVKLQTMNYILTYKFSQNHLVLFFRNIRSTMGLRNNCNCLQFLRAYKTLLSDIDLKNNMRNSLAQDQTHVIALSSVKRKTEPSDIHFERILENASLDITEDNEMHLLLPVHLNEFSENVVTYIAGYVIKMVDISIKCAICREALRLYNTAERDRCLHLCNVKIRQGGLSVPSSSLRKVCGVVERKLQILIKNFIPAKSTLIESLQRETQDLFLNENLFPLLSDHCFDLEPLATSHKLLLIREIIISYASIRINNLNSQQNVISRKKIKRSLLM